MFSGGLVAPQNDGLYQTTPQIPVPEDTSSHLYSVGTSWEASQSTPNLPTYSNAAHYPSAPAGPPGHHAVIITPLIGYGYLGPYGRPIDPLIHHDNGRQRSSTYSYSQSGGPSGFPGQHQRFQRHGRVHTVPDG